MSAGPRDRDGLDGAAETASGEDAAARAEVRRAYRALPDEPPPAELDARVLALARAAVAEDAGGAGGARDGARPARHAGRAAHRRWLAPGALAATVVLAVGVGLQVQREARVPGTPAPMGSGAEPASGESAARAPAVAATPASPPSASPSSASPRPDSSPAPAPVVPPSAYGVAAAIEVPRAAALPEHAAPADAAVLQTAPAAATESAVPATRAAGDARNRARDALPAPATWLARIETLRREGRVAEADAELERFRAAYPDHPLPR